MTPTGNNTTAATTANSSSSSSNNGANGGGAVRRKPARRANTAERRATHNAVERQRRETLNSRFLVSKQCGCTYHAILIRFTDDCVIFDFISV